MLWTFQIDLPPLVPAMLPHDQTGGGPMTRSKVRRQRTENQSPGVSETEDGERSLPVTTDGQNSAETDGAGAEVEVDQFEIIPPSNKELGTKTAIFLLLLIFLSSALAMFLVLKTFPDLNDEDKKWLKFPQDIDDAKELGRVLSSYKDQYFPQVGIFFSHGNIETTNRDIINKYFLPAGTCWVPLCLHLPPDFRHTRLHISLHNLWLSVPVPRGPAGRLLLLGHRSFLLLPPVLLGGTEVGQTLPPSQSCPVVGQGGESQVQPSLLHSFPPDHSLPSQLVSLAIFSCSIFASSFFPQVHQYCLSCYWRASSALLGWDLLWSGSSLLYIHPGGHHAPAAHLHHGPHHRGDCSAPRSVCST